MNNDSNISNILDGAIEKLKRQEETLLSNVKESINQWYGNLLIFAGLAMTVLSNQGNACAHLLIVFWLIEAAMVVSIFYTNRQIYDLKIIRHFEGTVSEEQEDTDKENVECVHKRVEKLEKYTSRIFFILTYLTGAYFFAKILTDYSIINL